jgi:hypothetical protein
MKGFNILAAVLLLVTLLVLCAPGTPEHIEGMINLRFFQISDTI